MAWAIIMHTFFIYVKSISMYIMQLYVLFSQLLSPVSTSLYLHLSLSDTLFSLMDISALTPYTVPSYPVPFTDPRRFHGNVTRLTVPAQVGRYQFISEFIGWCVNIIVTQAAVTILALSVDRRVVLVISLH